MTVSMLIVLAVAAGAIALFIVEPIPLDVSALVVLVVLTALGRWTHVGVDEALAGFSNPATLTVMALLILTEGVRRTGLVQRVAHKVAAWVGPGERHQLAATIAMAAPTSALVNNTPVVALLLPVVTDMAHARRVSPSRLLIPLSYASMLGGTLTLVGTSTNILAANISQRLLGHRIGMFEFTGLGVVVLAVGAAYLMLAAPHLLAERVPPRASSMASFGVLPYLHSAHIGPAAPACGRRLDQWCVADDAASDVVALWRGERFIDHPSASEIIEDGDILVVHSTAALAEMPAEVAGIDWRPFPGPEFDGDALAGDQQDKQVVEVVVAPQSAHSGQRVDESNFLDHYDGYVLALRSAGETITEQIGEQVLGDGDTLLLQTSSKGLERMRCSPDLVIVGARDSHEYRVDKAVVAVAIVAAVVGLAAFEVVPIVISALGGVVAMVATGVLRPNELYQGVDWRVIVLLAGIIPLGTALEKTGTAAYLGGLLAQSSAYLPAIVVLWLFYLATGLLTEVISNNATVLLMIPIAVSTAGQIGANPFAFILAVMFAASTAFLGPVGYQTNLFVYGPGGYRIRDFLRIGVPLQLLLSVVTVGTIGWFWGV